MVNGLNGRGIDLSAVHRQEAAHLANINGMVMQTAAQIYAPLAAQHCAAFSPRIVSDSGADQRVNPMPFDPVELRRIAQVAKAAAPYMLEAMSLVTVTEETGEQAAQVG